MVIEVWCNGSTRDFGSLGRGSNPLASTRCVFVILLKIFNFAIHANGYGVRESSD